MKFQIKRIFVLRDQQEKKRGRKTWDREWLEKKERKENTKEEEEEEKKIQILGQESFILMTQILYYYSLLLHYLFLSIFVYFYLSCKAAYLAALAACGRANALQFTETFRRG